MAPSAYPSSNGGSSSTNGAGGRSQGTGFFNSYFGFGRSSNSNAQEDSNPRPAAGYSAVNGNGVGAASAAGAAQGWGTNGWNSQGVNTANGSAGWNNNSWSSQGWSSLFNGYNSESTGPEASEENSFGAFGGLGNLGGLGVGTTQSNGVGGKEKTPDVMPLAIVGMSCRLPGNVSSPTEFWELLARARGGWSGIPKERFDTASFYHPNPGKAGCLNPQGGCFLNADLKGFDAPFFSLTEKEAISLDPQQRLLLECTFEALESAGIPKQDIIGKDVGVFVGGSFPEYEAALFKDSDTIPMHQATGCAYAMQSNRISHFFDLRGPSFTTDTACSSSLVALHAACQSLRSGESSLAIIGGCHLNMLPEFWISFTKSRLFSDHGHSYSFDARGTGFGRGEGCGVLILKPLDQARRDNDAIRAVIVGSGVNQDGRTPGITMPNRESQEALMARVYKESGLQPFDCGYVEAHGTGTKVGDPIEAEAVYNVLAQKRGPRDKLYMGSVKSNIGHLEAASGIVAVIKAALMLERGFIVPNHDFVHPNQKIPFEDWNLKIPIHQKPWPRNKKYISVNNFGFGGTNAHIVLEKAPFVYKMTFGELDPRKAFRTGRKLLVLTANDKASLEQLMTNTVVYLEQRPEMFQIDLMRNVAYTLGQRRTLLQWRVAIPASTSFEFIENLANGKMILGRETEPLRIGMIFTGQGAQWYGMGRELYEQFPIFQACIDSADTCLAGLGASWSLVEELNKTEKTTRVGEAHISQPACTVIQLALIDLFKSWGIQAHSVAGHSSGEIAAAYAAGILDFDSCVIIAYHRGRLVPEMRLQNPGLRGAMLAVGGSKEEFYPMVKTLKSGEARIACFNSPSSLTISGDEDAIDELQRIVEEKQMFNRRLFVDVAYHSHHMNLVAKEYQESLRYIQGPVSTRVRFFSSLLGREIDGAEMESSYWVQNLTCPVRFAEAVAEMVKPQGEYKTGVNIILEIGPHSALQGPLKQILKEAGPNAAKIPYAPALVRRKDAVVTTMELASALFTRGAHLDFEAINFPQPGKVPALLTDLPRYPWNHQTKYWHESRFWQKHRTRSAPRSDVLGTMANYSTEMEPTWRNIIRLDDLPWLAHHSIQSLTIFPLAGFVTMALEAAVQRADAVNMEYDRLELKDVSVLTPLVLPDKDIEVTLTLRTQGDGSDSIPWQEFRISSWTANQGWKEHCKGFISVRKLVSNDVDGKAATRMRQTELKTTMSNITAKASKRIASSEMYEALTQLGVAYGPMFQGINDSFAGDGCAVGKIKVPDIAKEMPNHYLASPVIHPSLLESLIEMYWPILAGKSLDTVYLASSIGRMVFSRLAITAAQKPGAVLDAFCQGNISTQQPRPVKMTMFARVSGIEEPIISIEDLTIAPILEHGSQADLNLARELCYKMEWEPILKPLHGGEASDNTDELESRHPNSDVVIIHGSSVEQRELAHLIADGLELETGKRPELESLSNNTCNGKLCIFLLELEAPLLKDITAAQFADLQKIITSVQGILWIVRGAYSDSDNPDAHMIAGLSRTVRSETLLRFSTLDLDSKIRLSTEDTSRAVLEVFKAAHGCTSTANSELEFMERNGFFYTPRIVNDADMNQFVHAQTKEGVLEPTKFNQESRPLKIAIGTTAVLDTLHFVDDTDRGLPLANDEIEIRVEAVGVNHRDIMAINGKLPTLDFGFECSGTVTRIGSEVSDIQTGDRVAALTQNSFSTYARTKAGFTLKISDDMSFGQAASIPLAYSTAYYGLVEIGRLSEGETVLIHGAAGAVGQAGVTIAQMLGAEVYATVGSTEKKEHLMREYGVPEDHILYSRDGIFGEGLRRATQNVGVDVVLNSLAGTGLQESWRCLNTFGRFVEIGSRDVSHNANVEMAQIKNNASLVFVDMFAMVSERPQIVQKLIRNVSQLLADRRIRTISPITEFPISDAETAFKTLQSGSSMGKLVVVPHPADVVQAPSQKLSGLVSPNATYVLVGGTGGLGRSLTKWMVAQGAKSIVLVSRSGMINDKLEALIHEGRTVGASIIVRSCDVSKKESVNALFSGGLEGLPPVRGVVHGTMVLHDVLFEKMTFQEYTSVMESKVHGAWNIHNALIKEPLDFFIAISSVASSVGNRGQASYAAANAFLNAFVQYRRSLGLPACSIDPTAISDTGYLAENKEAAEEVAKNLGSDLICEAEVLALVGAAVNGRLAKACNGHTITGVRMTPSMQPFWTQDAKFKHLRQVMEVQAQAESSSSGATIISPHAALKAAKTPEEADDAVRRGLVQKISTILMMEEEDLDITRPLSHYPLDSLIAIEIRNFITREFEANLQVLELLSSGSIETLSKVVCEKSKLVAH